MPKRRTKGPLNDAGVECDPQSGLPYAEGINYWQSNSNDPNVTLGRAKKLIEDIGGRIDSEFIGMYQGQAMVVLGFTLQGESFRIDQVVLPSREKGPDCPAARRQAASMIHHAVKNRVVEAKVKGAVTAFVNYKLIQGTPVEQLADPRMAEMAQRLLPAGAVHKEGGDVIDVG